MCAPPPRRCQAPPHSHPWPLTPTCTHPSLSHTRADQASKAGEIKRLHEDLEKGKRELIEKETRFAREVERMGRVVKAQADRLQQRFPLPGGPDEDEEGGMTS